jgi:DNA-binding CsgD family transcriptional regulator
MTSVLPLARARIRPLRRSRRRKPEPRQLTALANQLEDLRALAAAILASLQVSKQPRKRRPLRKSTAILTARERKVLSTFLGRLSLSDAARRLATSPNTVRNQLNAIQRKLGVKSRLELVAHYLTEQS